MKVVMLGDFPPRIGGVSSHIHTLSRKLVEEGHEVFVIAYSHKNLQSIDGIEVISARVIDKPIIRPLTFIISAKRKLEELIKKEDIDIIHGHLLLPAGLVATELGCKFDITTYVTAHGGDMLKFYNYPLLKRLIVKVLDRSDKVLAVSNHMMNEIFKTNVKGIQDKTLLHLNAVDIGRFKEIPNKSKKEKPTVIFVGVLYKRKNVDLLLDAKKQSRLDYNLIIVGDGSQRDRLEKRVEKENIGNVKFTGFMNNVEDILPHADLFVLPSDEEAFGIVYIEALACGLPVIGCAGSGVKEIINEDVGLLVKPNDVNSLTDAIDKILTDEKLYNKLKSNARRRAIEFSEMKIPYTELL